MMAERADVRSERTLRNILLSALADGSIIVGIAREQVPAGLEGLILPGRCYGILRWRDVVVEKEEEKEEEGEEEEEEEEGETQAPSPRLHLCIFSPWKSDVSMRDLEKELDAADVVPDTIDRQAFWVDVPKFVSIFERTIVSRQVAKGWSLRR